MEIEVPVENPRPFSSITRHHRHILQLETVLVTIWYPAAFGAGSGPDPAGNERWSRGTWLPRPRPKLSKGYARFAGLPEWPTMVFFLSSTWFTKMPAYRNAPLASHWAAAKNTRTGGFEVKNEQGRPPPEGQEMPCHPLLLFSHGLGGTRTSYSTICGEFASYGFIVCAVEHRDGSGPRTFINHPAEGEGSRQEREQRGGLDHWDTEREKEYDMIDYIFPKDNPRDTDPGNDPDESLRAAQIEMRLAELEETYHLLCLICQGKGETIAKKNLRKDGGVGSSSRGLLGIDWNAWEGRFDTQRVTMVGHSFGAATTVEVLRHAERFSWVSQGIIYDIWGAIVKPPEDDKRHRITAPLLGVNSEAFMYWPDNFNSVMALCQEARDQGTLCWLMTIRGSIHLSQSDFPLLYPHLASLLLKMTVNPQRAIDITLSASLEFLSLSHTLPAEQTALFSRAQDPHDRFLASFLDDNPDAKKLLKHMDDLPAEHRPDEKWIGMRLKINHEFSARVAPKLRRKAKRARGDAGEVEEIWMHVVPKIKVAVKDEEKIEGVVENEEEAEEGKVSSSSQQLDPSPPT
ncbi:MAG: hypothetical protein M1819_000750 [Sarea resinae]|nr:MAG: hypothetical protein M1819_000750 [Sarea resinae]